MSNSIGLSSQVYLAFIRNAFLEMLAYRMRYITGILTYLLFVGVNYFIWEAVFASVPEGSTIKGYNLAEMVTYISIAWVSRSLYFSNIDEEIDELVKSGQITVVLVRPVNFHSIMLSLATGQSLFRLIFFTFPIAVVILWAFPVMPPASFKHGLMFLLSSCFSFLVLAELNFIVGLLSFYIKSIEGIGRAKYFIVQLFSGLLLPLSFFPPWAAAILNALPFVAISYLPLQCYLGKVDLTEFVWLISKQFIWFIVLYVIGQLVWKRAIAYLTLQGG